METKERAGGAAVQRRGYTHRSGGTQNIGYPDAATGNGVYTNSATAYNGKREASFTQSGTVGTSPQALALILLTRTGFTQGATPSADTLTYGLELKVNSALPTGANTPHALTPADLVPTTISLNGAGTPTNFYGFIRFRVHVR